MSEEILMPSSADGEASDATAASIAPSASEACLETPFPVLLSVGQQLQAARETKGLTAADVAKALKLSVHQVIALEQEDWSHLPGNTIIRGFVRNYARLLKLDPEPLMQALSALHMPQPPSLDLPSGSNTALPQTGNVERRDFATVFLGLALVVLAVLAYFFVPQDFWQSKLSEWMAGSKAPAVLVENGEPLKPNGPSDQVAPAREAASAEEAPVALPVPSAAPAGQSPQASAADSSSGLRLIFAEPSWVEIRDRSGQIIFSQLNPAGSQRDIEGQPPFALVIGNATHVTVQYKGKLIELSQRSKDDVARLNLD